MMIRLDDYQNEGLRTLAAENRRSKRKEVLMAVDFYLRSKGLLGEETGEQPPVHPDAA